MKYPMYSIRDSKVGFMTPTIDQNDAVTLSTLCIMWLV